MKVLLSAYACEPNEGSEPGVGWNWAIELAKIGSDVWVVTRTNNQEPIESELRQVGGIKNLHFLYFDLPGWARRLKKVRGGIYPYYVAWQWGAYRLAKQLHAQEKFDLVHHVTFVTVRQPSFMGRLGIPFIFGPVGGGECAPWRLRFHYGMRGFFIDAIRGVLNLLVKIDPLMWQTFYRAQKIFVTSRQTKKVIPFPFKYKTEIQLAIGLNRFGNGVTVKCHEHQKMRILYVGNFLYWKGMGLGMRSFASFVEKFPASRLTMVGKGHYEKKMRRLAERLNISSHIHWVPWVERNKLAKIYQEHDVFLFPSLHDSGGMVVLEAMAHGLPVVCLDLGGPGAIVNDSCGRVINTKGVNEAEVCNALGNALLELATDKKLLSRLKYGALKCCERYGWGEVVGRIYAGKKHE